MNPQPDVPPPGTARRALGDLGYVNGKNVIFEVRSSGNDAQRLAEMADELVRLKVDVIVAGLNQAAFAARRATSTIPIVVMGAHAAVEIGLVKSLARPGGNVTGVESLAPELDAKRLELLREILPRLGRVGLLHNPADPGAAAHLRSIAAAARSLTPEAGVTPLEVRNAADFEPLFETPAARALDAVVLLTDPLTFVEGRRFAEIALAHRIPTACEFRFLAQWGCLIAYGPTPDEFAQRSAHQVDLILKGAKPGDLPFEQVTRFELVVNLKTARALGIALPVSVLLRADAVIE